MNKADYMNALKQALEGLPTNVMEETLWDYESKFIDALMLGRTEEDIVASLPSPQLVAAQQRNKVRMNAFKHRASPANLAALLVSLLGVMVFNLFMIIPAFVYSCLLFAAYLTSLGLYVAGIVIVAGSLSGVEHLKWDMPSHNHGVVISSNQHIKVHSQDGVKVEITPEGITVDDEYQKFDDTGISEAINASKAPASAVAASSAAPTTAGNAPVTAVTVTTHTPVSSAAKNNEIEIHVDNGLRSYHALHGIGLLFAGIALFMLSLFVTKYTFIGFKNYLQWNVSLLRLPAAA